MSDKTEAVKELVRLAKKEKDPKIRKEAIFWLGQKASEESIKTLRDVVNDTDEDTKVKGSAVFAISQLPSEKSVPMLIDIARKNKNPKVQKQAIFWLGQKDDEAALKFFEEILLKKK
jgi:HEAT repeat protein